MFSFLRRKRQLDKYLGLGFHQDGISIALASRGTSGDVELEHLDFQMVLEADSLDSELRKLVNELGYKGLPVVVVLDNLRYSLLQIEVPEVSDEELKNAVRWRIKDLIDFHVDDATIDVIMLPESKRAGAPRLMYVVATRQSYLQQITEFVESAGLELLAIDIAELTLRNMTWFDADPNQASAMLYLSRNLSMIEICDSGSLCLSRHINIDPRRIGLDSEESRVELMDMLSLEVQRSLDYYETQFANGPATRVSVVSEGICPLEDFRAIADSYLTAPVEALAAVNAMKGIDRYDQELVATCLPTLGGAVRELTWNA